MIDLSKLEIGKAYLIRLSMQGRILEYSGKFVYQDRSRIKIVNKSGLDEYRLNKDAVVFFEEIENFEIPKKVLNVKTSKRSLKDSEWKL